MKEPLFEVGPEHTKTNIRSGFPEFKVEMLDDGDALITCPTVERRCGNGFIVNYKLWKNTGRLQTRPCPYCFAASKIPDESTDDS